MLIIILLISMLRELVYIPSLTKPKRFARCQNAISTFTWNKNIENFLIFIECISIAILQYSLLILSVARQNVPIIFATRYFLWHPRNSWWSPLCLFYVFNVIFKAFFNLLYLIPQALINCPKLVAKALLKLNMFFLTFRLRRFLELPEE